MQDVTSKTSLTPHSALCGSTFASVMKVCAKTYLRVTKAPLSLHLNVWCDTRQKKQQKPSSSRTELLYGSFVSFVFSRNRTSRIHNKYLHDWDQDIRTSLRAPAQEIAFSFRKIGKYSASNEPLHRYWCRKYQLDSLICICSILFGYQSQKLATKQLQGVLSVFRGSGVHGDAVGEGYQLQQARWD